MKGKTEGIFATLLLGVALLFAGATAADDRQGSRLRFRSGPPCMCKDGLGEKEIQEAERRRELKKGKRNADSPAFADNQKPKGD